MAVTRFFIQGGITRSLSTVWGWASSDKSDRSDKSDSGDDLPTCPTCLVRYLFDEALVSRDPLSYGR